jgi:aminopeptidase N
LGEETVAHETAHQWFGDAVTPVAWRHLWLSEGFATYFAALWVGWADGDTAFHRSMQRSRERVLVSDATRHPILIDSLPDSLLELLNTNAYQKGAWTLHELRGLIGDRAFFEGIRTYVERFRHATASSADLRAVMEGVARRDLGWFFRQALEQPGFPILEVTATRGPGRQQLTLTVRQRQPAADGWYRLPGLVVSLDGRRAPIDVQAAATTRVVLDGVESLPRTIAVDPDGWWLLQVAGGKRP